MAPETEPLDVLTIGEMVVDFISVEKTDTLSYATTFRRYLGGSPANIAVYVSTLGGTSAVVAKPSLEDARRLFDVNMDEETAISEFHDLGAKLVILTRSGGVVTVSDNGNVEGVGPLPKVEISNVTGARDAFWSALLMAHLDGKDWPEAVRFAHEVVSLKLRVEGHVERMIDRESLYASLKSAGQRTV
jgi:sugar/nucleoside kinase (ribokinase family)